MARPIDLTGQKFGKLTAIYVYSTGRRRKWFCQCDCGSSSQVTTDNLLSGNSKACGNCRIGHTSALRHGHARARTPTYMSWCSMRRRINNSTRPHYGGIDIDPRWLEFENFLTDMGERPAGMTIDRKDNKLGYWKDNCRWATPTQQTRNRRIALVFEFEGRALPIAEWAKEYGITYGAAIARIKRHNSLRLP